MGLDKKTKNNRRREKLKDKKDRRSSEHIWTAMHAIMPHHASICRPDYLLSAVAGEKIWKSMVCHDDHAHQFARRTGFWGQEFKDSIPIHSSHPPAFTAISGCDDLINISVSKQQSSFCGSSHG